MDKRRIHRNVFLIVAVLCITGCNGGEDTPSTPTSTPNGALTAITVARIDATVQLFRNQTGTFGMSVAVSKRGVGTLYSKGFGTDGNGRPVTPDTPFRIASISKQFTASAIMRLVERGQMNVTDPLTKYIVGNPQWPFVQITHLLTHTAGIYNFTQSQLFQSQSTVQVPISTILNLIQVGSVLFTAPGTQFSYSNGDYFLLGLIVQQVSGKTLAQFLSQEFFVPLGMTRTLALDSTTPVTSDAIGFRGFSLVQPVATNWLLGAGEVLSTANDMQKWNQAFYYGSLLSSQSRSLVFNPFFAASDFAGTSYGYGVLIENRLFFPFDPKWFHGGSLPGMQSFNSAHMDSGYSITILTNNDLVGDLLPTLEQQIRSVLP